MHQYGLFLTAVTALLCYMTAILRDIFMPHFAKIFAVSHRGEFAAEAAVGEFAGLCSAENSSFMI